MTPLKPSLEYLHQYPVSNVYVRDGSWVIEFEGGAQVFTGIAETEEFPSLTGLSLLTTMLSADETRMVFGRTKRATPEIQDRQEISVGPTQYEIYDPRFGEQVAPQQAENPLDGIAEVEGSRMQEGPEEIEEAPVVE